MTPGYSADLKSVPRITTGKFETANDAKMHIKIHVNVIFLWKIGQVR